MTETGGEALAEVLKRLQGLESGMDPAAAAEAIWPAFRAAVGRAVADLRSEEVAGVQQWQEARHGPGEGRAQTRAEIEAEGRDR